MSILKALAFLGIGFLCVLGPVAMLMSEKKLFDPAEGGIFWARIVMAAVMVMLALWMVLLVLRTAGRWLMADAGILLRGEEVVFRVPRLAGWFRPFYSVEEVALPRASVKGTSFSASESSVLTVETDRGRVEIPSGAFGADLYAVEAAVKGPSASAEPKAEWAASSRMRRIIGGVIAAVIGAPIAAMIVVCIAMPKNKEAPAICGVALALCFILSLAFIMLLACYRGRLIADARGVFYACGGTVSFAPWELLDPAGVDIPVNPMVHGLLSYWRTLVIKTRAPFLKRPACKIHLARFLGMGFPIDEIRKALQDMIAINAASAARAGSPEKPAQSP
jgi:hypothetical protein